MPTNTSETCEKIGTKNPSGHPSSPANLSVARLPRLRENRTFERAPQMSRTRSSRNAVQH